MSSSFSKNLTSSIGISLGGLDIVTDFLFTNPEFYETDLAEVKSNIFGQTVKKQHYEKPVRPKKTKESIINKFSILQCVPVIQKDEVLESNIIVNDTLDDMNFDFDDIEVTLESVDNDNEVLEANSLMQKISNMNNCSKSENTEESDDELNIDIEDDEIDIDIEDTELDIEDDIEDDIDIEEDDIDIENDELDIEDDDIDIEDDELDIEEDTNTLDNFENNFTVSDSTSKDKELEIDIEDDEIDIEDDELDIEDNDVELNIEENSNLDTKKEDSTCTNNNVVSANKDNHNTCDSDKDRVTINNTSNNINSHDTSEEMLKMQQKVADMERQLHELKSKAANDSTSNIDKNVNKNNDNIVDKLTSNNKQDTKQDLYEHYSCMSVESLYNEVKIFMNKMGVQKRTVEISTLNNKFGELNIRKLIQKSYLIRIGKGVTTGR